MNQGNAAVAYRRNAILTASPEKLVVMMYEGAIRHLERAHLEMKTPGRSHSAEVGDSLGKAMAIIGELRTALDHEKGGNIALDLDRLYDFCLDQIFASNVDRTAEAVQSAIGVMKTLKEGWDEIIPA